MKTSIPSLLCFVSLLVLIFATDLRAEGEVTIPYEEMKKLWESLQEKNKKPVKKLSPIQSVLTSADYDLEVTDNRSQLTAD